MKSAQLRIATFVATASAAITFVSLALTLASAIPDVASFYIQHPDLSGFFAFMTKLAGLTTILSAGWAGYLNLASYLVSLLGPTGPTVQIIKPSNLADFVEVFSEAKQVRAYNPPLSLLCGSPSHRGIIKSNLFRNDFDYRAILGRDGRQRVVDLYNMWMDEMGDHPAVRAALGNMKVVYYEHQADLHTVVSNFGELQSDIRGLSFFLVEKFDGRKLSLLYLLGRPFVDSFTVPDQAIRITETREAIFYDQLAETFDKRWRILSFAPDGNLHPRELPEFAVLAHSLLSSPQPGDN